MVVGAKRATENALSDGQIILQTQERTDLFPSRISSCIKNNFICFCIYLYASLEPEVLVLALGAPRLGQGFVMGNCPCLDWDHRLTLEPEYCFLLGSLPTPLCFWGEIINSVLIWC